MGGLSIPVGGILIQKHGGRPQGTAHCLKQLGSGAHQTAEQLACGHDDQGEREGGGLNPGGLMTKNCFHEWLLRKVDEPWSSRSLGEGTALSGQG